MGDFMQDDVGLGRRVQRRPVPIVETGNAFGVSGHSEAGSKRKSGVAIPFGFAPCRAIARGRANPVKHRAGKRLCESSHEPVESVAQLPSGDRRQNHLTEDGPDQLGLSPGGGSFVLPEAGALCR